ncbi:3-carboxy-cis,cis-muconate cycloisomerase [Emticicia sp. BO119]|uniref:3-carboxy-cis,cis-muconate cycloisomerase n=1 Tax=Emticicia sp. BO119 TaxID=2757768 RepID=UPI0015F08168|nr:3-carboxy-cis,cis-muconate cycloisomerase [Emticicia sp. BO119]MBA4850267.1 3-carboxy-cis,cis-muconate cycloisomerase [Emticicia sp. BO119]
MSLYSQYFYSDEVNELLSDTQTIAEMLRVEGVLAIAQAEQGIIPTDLAETIVSCCRTDFIDIEKLKTDLIAGGNAAIPLVKQLTRIVKNNDVEASKYVHLGATSQDIVDTATVLQIQEFMIWLDERLDILSQLLINLTKKHRQTIMVGRTLLQQARPITFGLKTALWLQSIERTKARIKSVEDRILVVQLSGAVGSGNAFLPKEVQQLVAEILELNFAFSWQSARDNMAEWACVLGILVGSIGKIAKDISLLMQTEIAELLEGAGEGKGGSSTMPHKRNPAICAAILANTNRLPHLVATILSSMPQEHERSAGLWHSEWEVVSEIMMLTGGTVERTIELLEGLEVNERQMSINLELTRGLIYTENVSLALASKMGKTQAHELIEKASKQAIAQQRHLKEILAEMFVDLPNLDKLFMPEHAIGNSLDIIDEILDNLSNH